LIINDATVDGVRPLAPAFGATDVSIVVVSGNPRLGSRTLTAALAVADAIAGALSRPAMIDTIELASFAGELFADDRPQVTGALAALAGANIAVIATPVYKASYTGLLKVFLDQYGTNGLAGVTAVPVVVSASPTHSLAGEVFLRPLLVELGASVPTRAVALTEAQLTDLPSAIAPWAESAGPLLSHAANLRSHHDY
jgi:FMN reductase